MPAAPAGPKPDPHRPQRRPATPILKVFAGKDDAPAVLEHATLIEPYDAFLLVQATPAGRRSLARRYPVEDITDQYAVDLPNATINTARPRLTTRGKVRHPAYAGERLAPGPHHYLVQLRGPAGNDGSDHDGDGKINLESVTSPGTAKNGITVGACENRRPEFDSETYGEWWPSDFPASPIKNDPMADRPDQVVAFSSRGPTTDDRVKPDVVAPGTFILSTRSSKLAANNFAWAAYPPDKTQYFFMGGTSMATPLTSGAVALLREFLRKKRGIASPSAALLKALLIAGAQRLPGTAASTALADNHQGYGRVNLDRSVKRVLATVDGPALKTGKKSTLTLEVPTASRTLRIALCYSDAPGSSLINNLNLIVTDPGGKRYVGNQPASTGSTLTLDATNNVEVVQVAKAKKGTWTLDVVASNVSSGSQDFALAAILV